MSRAEKEIEKSPEEGKRCIICIETVTTVNMWQTGKRRGSDCCRVQARERGDLTDEDREMWAEEALNCCVYLILKSFFSSLNKKKENAQRRNLGHIHKHTVRISLYGAYDMECFCLRQL